MDVHSYMSFLKYLMFGLHGTAARELGKCKS